MATTIILTPNTPHYAKEVDDQGHFLKWVAKPWGDERTKSTSHTIKQVLAFHNQEEERCFFCRRSREQLGDYETLTLDHIAEIGKEKGKDEVANLQVLCTACHKLKNWLRLYMNWHKGAAP
jgi:hypothetical protein